MTRGRSASKLIPVLIGAVVGVWLGIAGIELPIHFWLNVLIAIVVMAPLAVGLHELGHSVAAAVLGLRVFAIILGYGRPLVEFKLYGIRVTICAFPRMGVTRVGASPGSSRIAIRGALSFAAGPITNLALLALTAAALGMPGWGLNVDRLATGVALPEALQLANLLAIVSSLIPVRWATPVGVLFTDGLQIMRAIYNPRLLTKHLIESGFLHEALESMHEGDIDAAVRHYHAGLSVEPESFLLRNGLAVATVSMGDFQSAREEFVALMDSSEAQALRMEPLLKNNVAYADVMLQDPALLEEADSFSSEAFAASPKVAAFRGTRGTVLVWKGEYAEGRKLLLQAHRLESDAINRAETASWLALAELRLGKRCEAEKWLGLVEGEGSDHPATAIVRRELAQAQEGAELEALLPALDAESQEA